MMFYEILTLSRERTADEISLNGQTKGFRPRAQKLGHYTSRYTTQ